MIEIIRDHRMSLRDSSIRHFIIHKGTIILLSHLSLNVSTKWKVALYKYFRLHPEQVTTSYEKAKDILEAQPKARIESLNYIFHILKAAFEAANIDGFECEP